MSEGRANIVAVLITDIDLRAVRYVVVDAATVDVAVVLRVGGRVVVVAGAIGGGIKIGCGEELEQRQSARIKILGRNLGAGEVRAIGSHGSSEVVAEVGLR